MIDEVVILTGLIAWFLRAHFICLCLLFFSHNALDEFLSLSSILVLFFARQKHSPPALLSSATAEWLMINDP